jgi:hypothetical protein
MKATFTATMRITQAMHELLRADSAAAIHAACLAVNDELERARKDGVEENTLFGAVLDTLALADIPCRMTLGGPGFKTKGGGEYRVEPDITILTCDEPPSFSDYGKVSRKLDLPVDLLEAFVGGDVLAEDALIARFGITGAELQEHSQDAIAVLLARGVLDRHDADFLGA